MTEKAGEPGRAARTVVQVHGAPLRGTLRELRHAAEQLSGADLGLAEHVHVVETTKKWLNSADIETIADQGEVKDVERRAMLEAPRSDMSLDEIVSDVPPTKPPAGAVAARRIIIIDFGPVIVIVIEGGPIIVILGW